MRPGSYEVDRETSSCVQCATTPISKQQPSCCSLTRLQIMFQTPERSQILAAGVILPATRHITAGELVDTKHTTQPDAFHPFGGQTHDIAPATLCCNQQMRARIATSRHALNLKLYLCQDATSMSMGSSHGRRAGD